MNEKQGHPKWFYFLYFIQEYQGQWKGTSCIFADPNCKYPKTIEAIKANTLVVTNENTIRSKVKLTFIWLKLLTNLLAKKDKIPPIIKVSKKNRRATSEEILPVAEAWISDALPAKTTWYPTVALTIAGSKSRKSNVKITVVLFPIPKTPLLKPPRKAPKHIIM